MSTTTTTIEISVDDAIHSISDELRTAGRVGYEAHADFMKTYVEGAVVPPWDTLPTKVQGAWIKAAFAILTSGE